ncbi:hypothetical protein T492DRAFT_893484 [Pavlovales sp. CCMP2436]|nr:hypothetical protein T492DRAFT_893484 [Pavlovales sp. CCMP2436]
MAAAAAAYLSAASLRRDEACDILGRPPRLLRGELGEVFIGLRPALFDLNQSEGVKGFIFFVVYFCPYFVLQTTRIDAAWGRSTLQWFSKASQGLSPDGPLMEQVVDFVWASRNSSRVLVRLSLELMGIASLPDALLADSASLCAANGHPSEGAPSTARVLCVVHELVRLWTHCPSKRAVALRLATPYMLLVTIPSFVLPAIAELFQKPMSFSSWLLWVSANELLIFVRCFNEGHVLPPFKLFGAWHPGYASFGIAFTRVFTSFTVSAEVDDVVKAVDPAGAILVHYVTNFFLTLIVSQLRRYREVPSGYAKIDKRAIRRVELALEGEGGIEAPVMHPVMLTRDELVKDIVVFALAMLEVAWPAAAPGQGR